MNMLVTGKFGLPWLVREKRAKTDFESSCMPMEMAVLIHSNGARPEAGMKPLKGKRRPKDDEKIISARRGEIKFPPFFMPFFSMFCTYR